MPQMAPLLWLNLYVFFTVMLALIIILNYFIKTPIKVMLTPTTASPKMTNWKW